MDSLAAKPRFQPAASLRAQAVRYLLVGTVAFIVDFALLVVMTEFAGINYLQSAVAGFTAGLVVNYVLSTHYVFAFRSLECRRTEFAVFATIGVVGLALTEGILWCGESYLHCDYRAAKVVAAVTVLAWNFSVRKLLLFRSPLTPA